MSGPVGTPLGFKVDSLVSVMCGNATRIQLFDHRVEQKTQFNPRQTRGSNFAMDDTITGRTNPPSDGERGVVPISCFDGSCLYPLWLST